MADSFKVRQTMGRGVDEAVRICSARHGRWGVVIALLLLLWPLAGCAGPGPEDVVRQAIATLEASRTRAPSGDYLEAVYEVIDADGRATLEARAARASEVLGVPVRPWEAFRYHGLVAGDRVSDVEVVDLAQDRAVVEVRFAWVVPAEEGGPGITPEPARLALVREDGRWRLSLFDVEAAP